MESRQIPTKLDNTNNNSPTLTDDASYNVLIDFKALGGIITDEEGGMKKQSMQWLADIIQVNRDTLYEWMKRPGFWDLVNERRKEITPKSRLAAVHTAWYLKAVKGEFQHMQLWLANFDPNFRMPTEKIEVEAGNSWARLMEQHKNDVIDIVPEADAPKQIEIQEAEVIPSVSIPTIPADK